MRVDNDFADLADSRLACYSRHPVEDIEPEPTRSDEIAAAAELLQRVMAWAADARSIVQMGQRMYVMLYVLRPSLIEAMTLEQIGEQSQVTRQAIDKLVISFRDTFDIQSRPMKSNNTRNRCRQAQLNRHR